MIKKILIGIFIFIILLGIGGYLFLKSIQGDGMQIAMQYENEVISKYKRELNFSDFNEGLKNISKEKIEKIESVVINENIEYIQEEILKGTFSCEELVLFYVNRIKIYDGNYNSVIQLNPKALERAKEIDGKIQNGDELGELFGTIILIKDNIAEVNTNTSAGAYVLKDVKTKRDSFLVKKLKESDGIILGKVNLSEWSNFMSMPSSNGFSVLGGQTKNAYGKYDVGGSSSGSAVSASLGFASITLGSETSGSLIYPAGQNSVVAIKPTLGLLSRDLIVPISEAQDTAGVIGRSVEDVYKVFKSSIAYDENDPLGKHVKEFNIEDMQKGLDKNFLAGKRIGILKEDSERASELKKELQEAGAEVVEVSMDTMGDGIDMMSVLLYGMKEDVKALLSHKDVISEYKSLKDIVDFNKTDSKDRKPYGDELHQQALETDLSKEEYEKIVAENRKVAGSIIDNVMREKNIEVIASFSNELSGIYAPAMYPAVTVPAGYKEDGEPYGVTFVASLNEDYKLLNIAFSYEQTTLHRKNPKIK
ncbi:amidase family protein [Wukongibacter baidiensis]|uniref:amidase family protein n=1 Tax=Wukongibacter baidiensis TaxID=1723361 RepID=UPI003D7FC899